MNRAITLSLGVHDAGRRRAILLQLAAAVNAIGRNGAPSTSELLCRIADAYEYEPEPTAGLVAEIMRLAGNQNAAKRPR